MDPEKLSKWFETAKQFTNGSFWTDIFGEEQQAPPSPVSIGTPRKQPAVDIYQTAEFYVVVIDLPGVRKEDVELSAAGEHLYVKGEAKPLLPEAELVSRERLCGPFERKIALPEKIDQAFAHISAKFTGGLLEIRIPRNALPRKPIEIK